MPSSSRARLSAETHQALIVAQSARSLALAAVRAGYRAHVIDLFGDVDTRRLATASLVVPGELGQGFEADALLDAADRLALAEHGPMGLVYGSGLEARPELLESLAQGRRLWGNRPAVLRAIKDPAYFFGLVDHLGLPHPELRLDPPADLSGWLAKGVGGAGGSHIRPLAGSSRPRSGEYYQRSVSGRPISCLFLADGARGLSLGWSEQWPDPAPGQPFRFGGAAQPAAVPAAVVRSIEAALGPLVAEAGLRGLNSIDLMLDDAGGFHVLEINPRPGASLDIFDGEGEGALFGRHVAACEGRLDRAWQRPAFATAMSVVYADRHLDVPAEIPWPGWLADRPAPQAHIETGAPVCTVMAAAPDVGTVRALVAARARCVLSALAAGDGELLAQTVATGEDRRPDPEEA
jgi:uncharacterized protein